jgi:hypothetical protein
MCSAECRELTNQIGTVDRCGILIGWIQALLAWHKRYKRNLREHSAFGPVSPGRRVKANRSSAATFMSQRLSAIPLLACAVAIASLCAPANSWAAHIVAGPMVGSVTTTTARVWMELSTSDHVTVRIFDVNNNEEINAVGMDVTGPPPFVVDAAFGGLKPDHDYRISVTIAGVHQLMPPPKLVIHTMPLRKAMRSITVAFGSCANTRKFASHAIWNAITKIEPRAFIFAGNSTYLPRHLSQFPYTYAHALQFILERYDASRRFSGIQPLLRICPMYATWDNRDFGTIRSNKKFVFSKESMLAFEDYWPNPSYGYGRTLGTFCHFRVGDVAFFLLDDRTFRTASTHGPGVTMFGQQQLAWLKNRLMTSRANFKAIVDGDQFLADYHGHESWAKYQPEQSKFIHWIFAHQVSGVLFLSGHRGFGELTRRPANPNANFPQYPLYDLTSSSLAAAPVRHQYTGWPNPDRVGAPVFEHNFGLLHVSGTIGNRHLTLELLNSRGHAVLRKVISQSSLQP